jgi:carbon storage regulator
MLVLTRKVGERIVIEGDIIISVERITKRHVALGIYAPPEVPIVREELLEGERARGGKGVGR